MNGHGMSGHEGVNPDSSFLSGGGEMGSLMRAFDWSRTSLGPIEAWPQSLRTSVSTCLNSRFAIVMWWGRELITLYNDAYTVILGKKHPDALGAPAARVWPEIWQIVGPMLRGVMERGDATWSDNLLLELERAGYPEELYFTFSYSPIREESGGIGGIFTPVQETTRAVIGERRLRTLRDLAEAARASNARSEEEVCRVAAETLAKNAHDIPFAAFYLFSANGGEARLTSTAGVSGRSALLPEAVSLKDTDWIFAAAVRSGAAEVVSLTAELAGVPRGAWPVPPQQAMVLPVAPAGQPVGAIVLGVSPRKRLDEDYRSFLSLVAGHVTTAIAETRAFEEERRRAQALAELDRAKTAFFSNVSHEFRTPLTLMLGPLEEMLAMSALPAPVTELAAVTHRNALRLQKLVNTLLDFSRIEAGRLQATYEATDLARFTAELASTFRAAVEKAGLRFEVDCGPLPEAVYVDREMWEKVVLNLLSNAFKYTFGGAISVRLGVREGRVALSVADTGTGIPERELPHLFERFHRVEGARGRTQEGTGIGLALVAELIRLHGGEVQVSSRLGEGSTFTVSVPFGRGHLAAERVVLERSRSAAVSSGASLEGAWAESFGAATPKSVGGPEKRTRVLVADDNADMRSYIARLLGDDYAVETVANGEAALARILEDPPDLLLSDVMMPGLDGFGLIEALRKNPRTHALPVILLSARAGEEAGVEGLRAGASDYLVKPFTARELLARVSTHLEMARIRREAVGVLESITDGFFALDGEWRFKYVNSAAEEMTGMRAEDMLGKNHWELFPGAVGTIGEREYHRAVREQVAVEFEILYQPWNRWFAVKAYPVKPEGLSVYFRDISEHKRAQAALKESEERFQAMADSAPVLIWTTDPAGKCTWVNRPWLEFTGRAAEQELGDGWAEGLHPEDRDACLATIPAVVGRRAPYNVEYRLRRHDGEWRWLLVQGVALHGSDGVFTGYIGSCVDITDRKKAEAGLRESEELARSVIEGSPDSVEVLDRGGRTILINEQGRLLRGLSGRTTGVSWVDSWSAENRRQAGDAFASVLAGRTAHFECAVKPAPGSPMWLDVLVTPLAGADGAASRILCICRDVTAPKRADEELRQTAKLESLGVMAGGIAHDFNNLLTGILGNASLLSEVVLEEDRGMADDIVLAAERAADLTRQMLAFSGKGKFQICKTDLSVLVHEMLRLAKPSIERNVEIRLDLAGQCIVEGDPGQLQQVVMNLMINAAEAMEGRPGAMVVRTVPLEADSALLAGTFGARDAAAGAYVLLEVADNGKGMDDATMARIFDPFFTTKFTGRGLGLAAVSGIVRGHKGLMRVRSAPGEGTTFSVLFPCVSAAVAAAGKSLDPAKPGQGVILLADDEDIVRRIGTEVLKRAGYEVRTASDGREALEIFRACHGDIDAIVLDMTMPVMNGDDALRGIHEIDASVPVIVCSGYNEVEVIRRFTAQKVGAFLQKPYTAARLLEKVQGILGTVSV